MPVKPRVQQLSLRNKIARALWNGVWLLLYRPSPVPLHGWRRFLLQWLEKGLSEGLILGSVDISP